LAERRPAVGAFGGEDLPGDFEPDRPVGAGRRARSRGSGRRGSMTTPLRIALFSDSHYEANGVARTTNALEAYAKKQGIPLLSVHGGIQTRVSSEGTIVRLELERLNATSFRLEHDLRFDVAMWRHLGLVLREIAAFRPDVLHFTGPSDIGQLGVFV